MFQVGDLTIYKNQGVCKVEEIGTPKISSVDSTKTYYTLKPIYQECKIFVPIDSEVFMRPVITYDEAQDIISIIPSIEENVFNNSNIKMLEDYYQEFLKTHECIDLVKIIKSVYVKKSLAIEQGKKIGVIDERFMKKAEDLLYGEFSVALGIPKDEVKGYIEEKVKEQLCDLE